MTTLLTTPERLRRSRGLTRLDDFQAEELIAEASEAFAKIAEREFAYAVGLEEAVCGYGTVRLQVSRAPVISIASIEIAGSAFDPATYQILEDGVIEKVTGVWPWTAPVNDWVSRNIRAGQERRLITVTYTGGYVTPSQATDELPRTLPRDIERAVSDYCVTLYQRNGRDASITARSVPRGSATFRDDGFPAGFVDTAKSYSIPRCG